MVAFKINRPSQSYVAGGKSARSPRRRVLISGMFHSLTTSCQAAVRNLSVTGAAIDCEAPLKVGAEGVLQVGRVDALARVIWQKGQTYGIKFDKPLPNQLVLDLHRITEEDLKRSQVQAAKEWFTGQAG
ncbi:MAG TPA: PilZ domain-containing protein [Allosphingosinicella sp.]|jgi:hypothetical protein|nr:PilZ domain-containing protein [Allosphingosinicella sp.]HZG45536.1 PilZ domain-containing protein [Allosphingosinicella sp.]